jgi:hypothetical protein
MRCLSYCATYCAHLFLPSHAGNLSPPIPRGGGGVLSSTCTTSDAGVVKCLHLKADHSGKRSCVPGIPGRDPVSPAFREEILCPRHSGKRSCVPGKPVASLRTLTADFGSGQCPLRCWARLTDSHSVAAHRRVGGGVPVFPPASMSCSGHPGSPGSHQTKPGEATLPGCP